MGEILAIHTYMWLHSSIYEKLLKTITKNKQTTQWKLVEDFNSLFKTNKFPINTWKYA